MAVKGQFQTGMPHLGFFSLSESFANAQAVDNHWRCLGDILGKSPSNWYDETGDRIYAAVLHLQMQRDLDHPVEEDDTVVVETNLTAARRPYSMCETVYKVNARVIHKVTTLCVLVKRDTIGTNKKFAKVRSFWGGEDLHPDEIDALLERHSLLKDGEKHGEWVVDHKVNRSVDFNAADLFYFRNFVQFALHNEWEQQDRSAPQLAARRDCWFYGNVDDGDTFQTLNVNTHGEVIETLIRKADDQLLFRSFAQMSNFENPLR